MDRIASLPRRSEDGGAPAAWAEQFHAATGDWRLRAHQLQALWEARLCRGALLPMGVGAGKCLLSYLLPAAMGVAADRTVVLVPGALVREHRRQLATLRQHFVIPGVPHIISYEKVGHPSGHKLLGELAPELIIADEAHYLSNKDSARTARFLRYVREARPMFVAMSASLLRGELGDFAHLAELALRDGSPLPHNWNMVQAWDRALGVGAAPLVGYELGYMRRIATEPAPAGLLAVERGEARANTLHTAWARRAVNQRLLHTPGVVGTEEPSCDAPIVGRYWHATPEPPAAWRAAARELTTTLRLPCGQQVESALAVYEHQRTLELGYYARWVGVDDLANREWVYARRAWSQALGDLVGMRREGMDSPALAEEAVRGAEPTRPYTPAEKRALAVARDALRAWEDAQPLFHGQREWVYMDGAAEHWRAMVEALGALAEQHGPTLVWAADTALYRLVDGLAPGKVCWPGKHPGAPATPGDWRMVSVPSHGTGLNLQPWQNNLLLHVPSSAATVEQLLGRTHRPGQQHPHVGLWLMPGEDISRQVEGAELIFMVTSQKQRLTNIRW